MTKQRIGFIGVGPMGRRNGEEPAGEGMLAMWRRPCMLGFGQEFIPSLVKAQEKLNDTKRA